MADITVSEMIIDEIVSRLQGITGEPTYFYNVSSAVHTMYANVVEIEDPVSLLVVHNGEEETPAEINEHTEIELDIAIVCGIRYAKATWMRDIRRLADDVKRTLRADFMSGDPLSGLARDVLILNTDVFSTTQGADMAGAQVDVRVIFRIYHDDPTTPV